MRSAISRYRSLLFAALLSLGAAGNTAAQTDRSAAVSMTIPQARQIAAYALGNDQPELALQVSEGLLKADPRDPFAHFAIANAYAQMGRPTEGRRAAARAYRFSDTGTDRLQAAQLAAQLAYAEERTTLAQIWLRRTAIHTTTDEDEKKLARDYHALRLRNPWAFSLRGEIRPSNNVNNGSDSASNIINGVPDGGIIPGSAQALSGTIGAFDAFTTYRLRHTETSMTTVGGRLYMQRVALSDSAKMQAPGTRNSDFDSEYAELSLRHAFAVGAREKAGSAQLEAALGESRYGGEKSFRQFRIEATRTWRLPSDSLLSLSASAENRFDARSLSNDTLILGLGATWRKKLENGDGLSLSLSLRDSTAEIPNGTYRSATARATYAFAQSLGPAKVTAGLGLGYSDYPRIQAGCGGWIGFQCAFPIYSPRENKSVYGDVTFFFEDYDYAGFAPTLRLRAGRSRSNLSAYSSNEVSFSLGIQSKF